MTEIKNQITKRTMINFNYQKREREGERERGKTKQTTTADNPTITRLHMPHHIKKKLVVHPVR
jgi:hypothetical protein